MKRVSQTKQFLRDVKRMLKRGRNVAKLQEVAHKLATGMPLSPQHRDHPLIGDWAPSRDCHIEPDWILIYTVDSESLRLERTGTHSDLFKK